MKTNVTLNIYDVHRILKEAVEARYPSLEVDGISVYSWGATIFRTNGDMLVEPVRHKLDPEHAFLTKEPTA